MSTIKKLRIQAGAIQGEVEGAMGSINEVSIHVPVLPSRIFRRSLACCADLPPCSRPWARARCRARSTGSSPASPASRSSRRRSASRRRARCGSPDKPCRHILALHELFARRLGGATRGSC
jgi:hypothetical protein